jgi:cysteine-rich repeat protein
MKTCWLLIALAACGGGSDSKVCGDGEVHDDPGDPANREECDDGNQIVGDGCTACRLDAPSVCGDGVTAFDEACDDGNVTNGDGCSSSCLGEETLSLAWSFEDVATGQTTGCPTGFDTVRIVTQQVDEDFAEIGEPAIDLFSCADGIGSSSFLPARYVTFLEVTNNAGTQVYAQSVSYFVDLAMPQGTLPVTIVNDGGYFGIQWELRGASSNSLLTCAQAAASSLSLVATVTSSTMASEEQFDCNWMGTLTAPLLAGSYTVSVSALNAAQQAVGTAPPLVERVIAAPNKITDLGLVTVPITGL